MKIGQAIGKVDMIQPNTVSREDKIRWLQQLDAEVYTEVILTHEGWEDVPKPEYSEETDEETELLVAEPYDSIYVHWLQSKIDEELLEYEHFNNHMAAYQAEMTGFRAHYNRTHMPMRRKERWW